MPVTVDALPAQIFLDRLINDCLELPIGKLEVGDQFCQAVLEELPMEFALEAKALLAVSLEGAVG